MKNLKLLYQINVIAVLACVGMIVIGVNFLSGEGQIEEIEHELALDIDALELAEGIRYEFLNARRREKDFLLRFDAKYIEKHDQVMRKIDKELKALSMNPTVADSKQSISSIASLLKAYEVKFQTVSNAWLEIGLNEKGVCVAAFAKPFITLKQS